MSALATLAVSGCIILFPARHVAGAVLGRVRPSTTVPAALAVVAGGPPQGAFVWHYLVITGMRSYRVARPPVQERGPEHYPVRFMQ